VRREATQFAMAAINQNAIGRAVSTSRSQPCRTVLLAAHSLPLSSVEMRTLFCLHAERVDACRGDKSFSHCKHRWWRQKPHCNAVVPCAIVACNALQSFAMMENLQLLRKNRMQQLHMKPRLKLCTSISTT